MARSGSFSSTVTATSRSMPVRWRARATPTMPPPTTPTCIVMAALYGSPVAPAAEQVGRGRGDPVQEQQPVQVVELVQQRPGLDGVGLDQPPRPLRGGPFDRDRGR